jgi:oligosaccharide repeat unit polymerase
VIDAIRSPWLAYAILTMVTGIARARCGSWFAPAAFVGLVWSFFTGMSLLLVDYPVPGYGLWMLVLLVLVMQLGALFAYELQHHRESATPDITMALSSLIIPCRRWALICATVAVVGCVYFLVGSLEEFGLPFTPIAVLEVGAKWTLLRYDDVVEPWSVRLLVTWFHPAALLGGLLFACSRKRLDRTIAILTLLPAVAYGIFTGARSAILLGLTCWIGGYVATEVISTHGRLSIFSPKRIALLLLAGAAMVGMFAGIEAVRDTSYTEDLIFDVNNQKLSKYMFGSPTAFAIWYAHADVSNPEWGAKTFAGEFGLLHLKTRTVGTYLDVTNIIGTEGTNIYTVFRGLIEDFTEVGAILIAACLGGFAGWVYGLRLENRHFTLFWLSAFYATLIYSPLVSLFSFNGAALAWIIGWVVLRRGDFQNERPKPQSRRDSASNA